MAGGSRADVGTTCLRGLTLALGAVLVVLSLWVVVARFRYPIDGEWMTGAIRDGVDRVRDGKQLYVAPSARFIPFVYPPLYFWVSALVAHVCSTFVACKLVSIAATLAAGWGIWRISRVLGASTFWCVIGLLLHVASYSLTILFYDLERVDAFYAGMILVGVAVLFSRTSLSFSVLAGLLLGLSFFAKQAGLLAFASVIAGLLLAGERKRALTVGAAGLLALLLLGAYLEVQTGGWFRYYCLTLPQSHGIRPQRLSLFFITDVPRAFAITVGSLAVSMPVLWSLARRRKDQEQRSWQEVVLALVVAAGMGGAFLFRAHSGGWENVLVAWLPLGCAASAVAATRAEAWARGTAVERLVTRLLLGGVSLQLLGAMFNPLDLAPNADDLRERERLIALVRRLETEGEVLVTTTGGITKDTSAHVAALYDIVRAGLRAPADLLEGLEQRRYAAIFVGTDELDCGLVACNELETALLRHYFVAARRHERDRNGMTGYDARPRWVLRPRKRPLPPTELRQLFLRQAVEKGFAEMKSARSGVDADVSPSDDIEGLASRELEGGDPHGPR